MKGIFILISAVLFISGSCEKLADHKYAIRIRNESQHIISVYAEYILPDTTLSAQKPTLKDIQPKGSVLIYDNEVGDEGLIKFKSEKITIFILSDDTISKYSWNKIKTDYNILKRYEIKEKDLTDMGGSVVFP